MRVNVSINIDDDNNYAIILRLLIGFGWFFNRLAFSSKHLITKPTGYKPTQNRPTILANQLLELG
jgi:hypothetical protein